jgi:signal transduction histidine kinase
MKKPQTLRSRIIFFFCGYLTILFLIYSVALEGIFRISEDLVFSRQLEEISKNIKSNIEEYGKEPVDLPEHISVYHHFSDIPLFLRKYIKNRESGIVEIVGKEYNYHASILKIEQHPEPIYIFYNTGTMQADDTFESIMILSLIAITFLVGIIGFLLAWSVSNRILNPIVKLAHEVEMLSPDETSARLHYGTTKDEIGTLVSTINRLLEKISEYTIREREFTAHASHELRTPVTVIKGAVEVIRNRSGEETTLFQQPLSRIERAVSEMEKLIETFLLLARQGQKPGEDEQCDLSATVRKVVDSCRHIIGNKPVHVKLMLPDSLAVQAPESLVSIAVGNLVRNSFMYTSEGKVDISVHKDRVVISDNGPGIDPAQEGKGLGLTIVKRLCERMKWSFTIISNAGEGTCVELIFNHELSS